MGIHYVAGDKVKVVSSSQVLQALSDLELNINEMIEAIGIFAKGVPYRFELSLNGIDLDGTFLEELVELISSAFVISGWTVVSMDQRDNFIIAVVNP